MNNVELGQILFHSKKVLSYDCPDVVRIVLFEIEEIMLEYNIVNNEENPFRNTGNVDGFNNGTFEVHSFYWGDEPKFAYNFKFRDIEISWYKYLGRGMTINRKITLDELELLYSRCVNSLKSNNEL